MITLSDLAARELLWEYPNPGHRDYLLRSGEETIGRLSFDPNPGARSTGELEGARWTFLRHDAAFHPRVTVYAGDSAQPAAEFVPCLTGGGIASFSSGVQYCWGRSTFWSPRWCFRGRGKTASVCLSQESGPLRGGGKVKVCPDAARLPEAPLLVLLAWYLRLIEFEKLSEDISCAG